MKDLKFNHVVFKMSPNKVAYMSYQLIVKINHKNLIKKYKQKN